MSFIIVWQQVYFICGPQQTAPSRAFDVYKILSKRNFLGMVYALKNMQNGF